MTSSFVCQSGLQQERQSFLNDRLHRVGTIQEKQFIAKTDEKTKMKNIDSNCWCRKVFRIWVLVGHLRVRQTFLLGVKNNFAFGKGYSAEVVLAPFQILSVCIGLAPPTAHSYMAIP